MDRTHFSLGACSPSLSVRGEKKCSATFHLWVSCVFLQSIVHHTSLNSTQTQRKYMRHQIEIIVIIFSHLAVIYKLIPNANF
jgi:hypothetical protein